MYLLVFTTLMIAVIGTYTQVLGLQAARIASNQSSLGSAMLQWHAAAVSMAVSVIKTNPTTSYPGDPVTGPGIRGCALTNNFSQSGIAIALCPAPIFYNPMGAHIQYGTVTTWNSPPYLNYIANYKTHQNECVHLAAKCTAFATNGSGCDVTGVNNCVSSYDITNHQFFSFLFKDPTTLQNLVITFAGAPLVSATNPSPGYIGLVWTNTAWTLTGQTASDLLRQLNNAGAPNYSYGTFQNFPGNPQLQTSGGSYNLPNTYAPGVPHLCVGTAGAAACVANGSVAIVGTPDGF